MSFHLSQLNVAMAHRNYLGKIICESSNWQHIQRLKITILGANWQLFRLKRIAKCSYFILSIQKKWYIKFYWFVMKIRNLCRQFDDTIEVDFLLGINSWGLRSEWVNLIYRPIPKDEAQYMKLSSVVKPCIVVWVSECIILCFCMPVVFVCFWMKKVERYNTFINTFKVK